jgi:hypothetical protein
MITERRRACTAGAKPELNSPKGAQFRGAVSGEQAPIKGKGGVGRGETAGVPTPEE